MSPKDRVLFQVCIDWCQSKDPHTTWRRDDFVADDVMTASGVGNEITVGTMTAPLRDHGVIEQVLPGWWRRRKDAPLLTPETFEAYWKLPKEERSHQTSVQAAPQPTCADCGTQHPGEC